MENILNTILENTYTKLSLKHRVLILKSFLVSKLFTSTPPTFSQPDLDWLNSLPSSFYQNFNKDNVYAVFTQLESEVEKTSPLTLYLPFETNDQVNNTIGEFARKNFSTKLILDIKSDYNLIAGCAISWKGVLKDYSLKSRIDEKKGEILNSFKKFLR